MSPLTLPANVERELRAVGSTARLSGRGLAANPYTTPAQVAQRIQWCHGWLAALPCVCVDEIASCAPNRFWPYDESCHLSALPGQLDALHNLAREISLQRRWFHNKRDGTPHYDLNRAMRDRALDAGAVQLDRYGMCAIIRAWRPEPPNLALFQAPELDFR